MAASHGRRESDVSAGAAGPATGEDADRPDRWS